MWEKLKPVLEKHNVKYFADGGTLLGAYRDRQIIAHDDDMDLGIMKEDEYKLFSKKFTDDLAKSHLKFDGKLYKFFPTDNLNDIFIDIFVYNLKGDKVDFVSEVHKTKYPNAYYMYNELFPLSSYNFGKNKIKGANNPVKYFLRQYGENWYKPIKTHIHHKITKEDFKTY